MSVPDYIGRRIRRPIPYGCSVVPGSTPVVAFGDPTTAAIATLGLNPSKQEFLDPRGNELDGSMRRFETLKSLGVHSLAEASDAAVARAFDACRQYFHRNPYRWFDQLEAVLGQIGGSYYNGSACHLDLVQWATNPTWGRLNKGTKDRLLAEGVGFLLEQLRLEQVRLLLLNGRRVLMEFERTFGQRLVQRNAPIEGGVVRCRFFTGHVNGIRVVGWSTNMQSSFGVSNEIRRLIAERVAELSDSRRL